MAIYFDFDLSITTFEVTTIFVVTFLLTCSVSEILKDKKDKGSSSHHTSPAILDIIKNP